MHKRWLHSSLAHTADTVKRRASYPRGHAVPQSRTYDTIAQRTKYSMRNPALNDSKRVPSSTGTPVTKTFPPFDAEALIKQQTRLAGASKRTKSRALVDGDPTEYATTILDGDEYLPDGGFSLGTFVEVRRSGIATEGIVLGERYDKGWSIDILGSNGLVSDFKRTDVHFSIPNFASSDLAARCGHLERPQNPTQINARVEALKQLRAFAVKVEKSVQGSHMWDRQPLLDFYDKVKAKDPTMWGEISLKQATSLLYVKPDFINYYATHKYLADRPLRYVAHNGYFRSQVFSVRPLRDVQEIIEVDRLIKEQRIRPGKGKYFQFLRKAKAVISGWNTDPTLQTGRMSQDTRAPNWDEDDQLFLRFLLRSQQVRRTNQPDPYEMGRQMIINNLVSARSFPDAIYHEILIKLGVMAPWQGYSPLAAIVNPTGEFTTSNSHHTTIAQFYKRSQRISGTVLGPFDLHATDPLESVRQEYHGRVFVIDEASAEELDDGISVERIPSEPNNVWVHVHVADPARHIHPGHALSLHARKQFESLYLVNKSYPLFPPEMMYDRKAPMSLGSTKGSAEASRALTISMKLDNAGGLIDYKLQASILRNVRIISYDDVDAALGSMQHVKRPFGGAGNPAAIREPLTNDEVADLRLLSKIMETQQQWRYDRHLAMPFRDVAEPRLVNPIPSAIQSPFLPGATYRGFPEIDYIVKSTIPEGARAIVAEMMKLAGRAASCVARDKGVPLIRRGMEPIVFGEGFQELLSVMRPDAGVPYQKLLGVEAAMALVTLGVDLRGHSAMGIPASDGYSRVTSPLRRYADLAGHWQLHHILLGPNAPRRLPFNTAEMETLARESSVRAREVKILSHNDNMFWTILAVKYFARASCVDGLSTVDHSAENPLSSMRAYLTSRPASLSHNLVADVDIPVLGTSGFLVGAPKDTSPGADVQVRVKYIELGRFPKLVVERV